MDDLSIYKFEKKKKTRSFLREKKNVAEMASHTHGLTNPEMTKTHGRKNPGKPHLHIAVYMIHEAASSNSTRIALAKQCHLCLLFTLVRYCHFNSNRNINTCLLSLMSEK